MSFGTLASFIAGFGLIFVAIITSTDTPMSFVNLASILIVLGGTLAALFISFEPKVAWNSLKLIGKSFKKHSDSETSLKGEVGRIVRWAYIIQKSGLQGLENEITEDLKDEDAFLTYGADLVVTGYTGAEVKQILEQMIQAKVERERFESEALKKMGGDAPAFGMMGTLIGLVIMLSGMGSDPAAIGPSMAIALLTTFYGIILARLIFIPVATKISARDDVTQYKQILQKEGLILLAERKSPRYIQDKINSFVEEKEQFIIDRDMLDSASYNLTASVQSDQT